MEKYTYVGNNRISFKKRKKLEEMIKKLTELMYDINRKDGNNKLVKKQILEEKLIDVIKTYPELMYMLHYTLNNSDHFDRTHSFAYYALEYEYYKLLKEMCNSQDVCTMQMWDGNITIEYLALTDRYPLLFEILDEHPCLLRYPTSSSENLGLEFAYKINNDNKNTNIDANAIEFIKRFINDEIACLQVDKNGNNIGMLCAKHKNQELFELADKNPKARQQVNKDGDNMEMIANNNGLIVPPLSEEEVRDYYKEQLCKKVDEICK